MSKRSEAMAEALRVAQESVVMLVCPRCGHGWYPRAASMRAGGPHKCPGCTQPPPKGRGWIVRKGG